ncbi:hypothetical protein L211DRAFT_854661 [Terfezia boudieri ATCC MYA-4762]|uniref:Uncharacterized protein n=1 Tax=Terfezia boudieri ATCC MYA-4762 TaxID=1051890 RepID=A0A3N4L4T7_9PEZI|nr:hypothetical protein L211DRAFT_854661 [Terfezia boudieri ATCC MYA-4762]
MCHSLKAWRKGEIAPVIQEFKYKTTWSQVRIVEIESVDTLQVEDEAQYEVELRKELEHSYDRMRMPAHKCHHEESELRDSSVELAGPLDPSIDNELEETGDLDEAGGDLDSENGIWILISTDRIWSN